MFLFFAALRSFFSGIFKFLVAHPTVLLVIVSVLGGAYGGYRMGVNKTTAHYEPIMASYKKESEERAAKIAAVEEESRRAALQAAIEIADKQKAMQDIADNYEHVIDDMKKNPKIKVVTVVVKEPNGTDKPVDLFVETDGSVSCRQLPSAYVDTINNMVDAVNGKLKPGAKSNENSSKTSAVYDHFDVLGTVGVWARSSSSSWGQELSEHRQVAIGEVQGFDQSQEWSGRRSQDVVERDTGRLHGLRDTTGEAGERGEQGVQQQ